MTVVVVTLILVLSVVAVAAAGGTNLKVRTSQKIVATWNCQRQLEVPTTFLPHRLSPWFPHNAGFRRVQLNKWTAKLAACRARLHARGAALRTGDYTRLNDADLYALAGQAIRHGGIYSVRWGDASPILKGLCYEAVRRTFARYGNERWALHIVNRESGCNPGAVNTTYSDPGERATCIAQMIPNVHRWVDYGRCQRDLRYAVEVFVRLSRGGRSTGPWSL